ncbi:hypothetical protein nbrc107696_13160 [Gordonia spumicola]|uniref:DUF4822 domain-containing protein n=1 Tax=Gordonia spumicola TaxID=589161 RepID=A0A7I9V728_9ACTN|nr:DUF4822 domain-containing protein [Gordonia spumicola]GEE00870.1 hypothetical protein nbrc107696_13160 [Gordonia spumicola]
MKLSRILAGTAAAALIAVPLAACSSSDDTAAPATSSVSAQDMTPSAILSSTAWETTGAKNQDGKDVPLTGKSASNYVGFAYFNADGTFTMYTLDDAPKMQGDWTVSEDGKTRTIVSKDDKGAVKFTRDSEIITLTSSEFTYRTYPVEGDKSTYVDIIHTPTTHQQPSV